MNKQYIHTHNNSSQKRPRCWLNVYIHAATDDVVIKMMSHFWNCINKLRDHCLHCSAYIALFTMSKYRVRYTAHCVPTGVCVIQKCQCVHIRENHAYVQTFCPKFFVTWPTSSKHLQDKNDVHYCDTSVRLWGSWLQYQKWKETIWWSLWAPFELTQILFVNHTIFCTHFYCNIFINCAIKCSMATPIIVQEIWKITCNSPDEDGIQWKRSCTLTFFDSLSYLVQDYETFSWFWKI